MESFNALLPESQPQFVFNSSVVQHPKSLRKQDSRVLRSLGGAKVLCSGTGRSIDALEAWEGEEPKRYGCLIHIPECPRSHLMQAQSGTCALKYVRFTFKRGWRQGHQVPTLYLVDEGCSLKTVGLLIVEPLWIPWDKM
jgi:hypothetical protein